jgi:hypothetical protein
VSRPLLNALPLRPALVFAALAPALVRGATIVRSETGGKPDFLNVNAARHRLLAAHEKDATADFADLDRLPVLGRAKLGGVVEIIPDPRAPRSFASAPDDMRVAIRDAQTCRPLGSVQVAEHVNQAAIAADGGLIYGAGANCISVVKVTADDAGMLGPVEIAETANTPPSIRRRTPVWTTSTDGQRTYAQQFIRP